MTLHDGEHICKQLIATGIGEQGMNTLFANKEDGAKAPPSLFDEKVKTYEADLCAISLLGWQTCGGTTDDIFI